MKSYAASSVSIYSVSFYLFIYFGCCSAKLFALILMKMHACFWSFQQLGVGKNQPEGFPVNSLMHNLINYILLYLKTIVPLKLPGGSHVNLTWERSRIQSVAVSRRPSKHAAHAGWVALCKLHVILYFFSSCVRGYYGSWLGYGLRRGK